VTTCPIPMPVVLDLRAMRSVEEARDASISFPGPIDHYTSVLPQEPCGL
jgi:hypothetical protein